MSKFYLVMLLASCSALIQLNTTYVILLLCARARVNGGVSGQGGVSGHNPKFRVLRSEKTMNSINISTYNIAIYNQSIVAINASFTCSYSYLQRGFVPLSILQ